jgi:hypothetical protein
MSRQTPVSQGIGVYFHILGNYHVLEEFLTARSKKSKKLKKKRRKRKNTDFTDRTDGDRVPL